MPQIERACAEMEIGWLIFDTFYAIAGLGGKEENKVGSVDEAVAPLRGIAGRLDLAITLSRHERKSGGEVGTSGRGSSALTGAADTVLLLKRLPGNRSQQRRHLEITGRIEQARLTIELRKDGKYNSLKNLRPPIKPGEVRNPLGINAKTPITDEYRVCAAEPVPEAMRLKINAAIGEEVLMPGDTWARANALRRFTHAVEVNVFDGRCL